MAEGSSTDRVGYRLKQWRRQLIDLTRKNRLLNYRPTKRSTVEVVDELPQQVLRQLLDGEVFKFDPKPEEEEATDSLDRYELEELSPPDGETTEGRQFETRKTLTDSTKGDIAEYHQDDRLQTPYTEKRLDGNLTNIYRDAESALEEQGVNTLFLALGMLEWYEDQSSDESSLAPVILVPVMLERKTAASPFELSLRDEEPVLNPALTERVRDDFGIELPELPDLTSDLDVDQIFEGVRSAVSGFERWRLTQDVVLGKFSFQKFLMYRDLEEHADLFRKHSVIRSVCKEDDQEHRIGLPSEVEEAELDEEMSPWKTIQIREADSSQQRAMLAVREGHNLVIEGPPGTGKSQTISNIIADQLAEGRRVLFVSEKMAALEVVKTRLDSADLGAFCLELHSNKTRKTEFVRELRSALDFNRRDDVDHKAELERLERLTRELRQYVDQLHRPVSPVGWSPYEVIARLTRVEDQPRVRAEVPNVMVITAAELKETLEELETLARALMRIGDPGKHPLRGFGLTRVTRTQRAHIEEVVKQAGEAVADLTTEASEASEFFGFKNPETLGDVELMLEGSTVVADSPGAEISVLENSRWDDISGDAKELLEVGNRYRDQREETRKRFRGDLFKEEIGELADRYDEELERGIFRFFRPAYWKIRGRARGFLNEQHSPDGAEGLREDLRLAESCQQNQRWLENHGDLGRELFGNRWKGPDSDWEDLREFANWVVELRRYAINEVLGERGFQLAAEGSVEESQARAHRQQVRERLDRARSAVQDLLEVCEIDPELAGFSATPEAHLGVLGRRIDEIESSLSKLRDYSAYRAARDSCKDGLAGDFIDEALDTSLAPDHIVPAFRRLFFERWLEEVFEDRQLLGRFRTEKQERRLEEFRDLDARSHQMARERARHALQQQRQKILKSNLTKELQRVQREAKKQRRIMPIRKLLRRSPNVIQLIKPCFMMSPLSVAKYLDPEVYSFDLLVFDEASQIPPADAVGAMIRASQVVVVGDEKQLPPTQFFETEVDNPDELDDEDMDLLEDMESILEEVSVSGVPSVRLKWHYRSEHESLIHFSNEKFYEDDPLYTFPHPVREDSELGLQFEYLEDAVYAGRGKNPREARRVADAVIEHIKRREHLSLGVGTFGMAQQRLIQDELDEQRRRHPEVEWFFSQTGEDKFFVKNLETIQGDDRDVIFISVTYGPDENGKLRRSFGPINRDGGWKRLNVITTRAKKQLRVFSSMRADDIDPRGIKRGARLLRDYLKYAETGELPSSAIGEGPPESPFEVAVKQKIENLGYDVVPQVGESGYRIDLGVLDPENPGRFLCGIECDGATYHRAATVRDRDRIRQQVLEDRGWDIHRIWSTDWFHDRRAQVERLEELIEESRQRAERAPKQEVQAATRAASAHTELKNVSQSEKQGTQEQAEKVGEPVAPGLSDDHKVALEEIPVDSYEVAQLSIRGDSESFYKAPIKHLSDAVVEVAKVEAPIPFRMLTRRVAAGWGLSQAGSTIRRRVEKAIERLEESGKVERRSDFVWLSETDSPPLRSRDIEEISFRAKHLPPEEVDKAIRTLLEYRAPLLPDDIPPEAAKILGFKRTGKKLRSVIEKGLERLREWGELEVSGLGIRLAGQKRTKSVGASHSAPSSSGSAQPMDNGPALETADSDSVRPVGGWRSADLTPLGLAVMRELEKAFPESLAARQLVRRVTGTAGGYSGDPDKSQINSELYGDLKEWLSREGQAPPRWSLAVADQEKSLEKGVSNSPAQSSTVAPGEVAKGDESAGWCAACGERNQQYEFVSGTGWICKECSDKYAADSPGRHNIADQPSASGEREDCPICDTAVEGNLKEWRGHQMCQDCLDKLRAS